MFPWLLLLNRSHRRDCSFPYRRRDIRYARIALEVGTAYCCLLTVMLMRTVKGTHIIVDPDLLSEYGSETLYLVAESICVSIIVN